MDRFISQYLFIYSSDMCMQVSEFLGGYSCPSPVLCRIGFIFIIVLMGGIILSTVLVTEPSELESEPTSKLTEDEETKLTPQQQLKEKIKEVATIIKQRHENRMIMLSAQGEGF